MCVSSHYPDARRLCYFKIRFAKDSASSYRIHFQIVGSMLRAASRLFSLCLISLSPFYQRYFRPSDRAWYLNCSDLVCFLCLWVVAFVWALLRGRCTLLCPSQGNSWPLVFEDHVCGVILAWCWTPRTVNRTEGVTCLLLQRCSLWGPGWLNGGFPLRSLKLCDTDFIRNAPDAALQPFYNPAFSCGEY